MRISPQLNVQWPATCSSSYAIIREALSPYRAWNGTALESWDDAHYSTYVVDLPSHGAGLFADDVPADLPVGMYAITYRTPATDTPAMGDIGIPPVLRTWNGDGLASVIPTPPADPDGCVVAFITLDGGITRVPGTTVYFQLVALPGDAPAGALQSRQPLTATSDAVTAVGQIELRQGAAYAYWAGSANPGSEPPQYIVPLTTSATMPSAIVCSEG